MAVLLVQVVHHCPGVIGDYSSRVLEAASSQGTGVGWKDLLPLPVPPEVAETVKEVLDSGEHKIKKAGLTGGAVRSLYRKRGIDCLVYCMVVSLNCMWGGLRKGTRLHQGEPKANQVAALDRLQAAAAYVIDSKDGQGAIPRSASEDWEEVVKASRISYHGELVEKAEPLEVDRVLASLPPVEAGGSVDILALCEEPVRREWDRLAKELYDRGIVEPTDTVASVRDQWVANGLFGVKKSGKDFPDGRPAQRLIMDLRATNAVMRVIAGDISTLAGASAFTNIVLEEGKLITLSGDDLCSSFYLFRLPDAWKPFMAFERKVSWRVLGVDRDGDTHVSACVLPMGFASSVGLMQHVHRRLALWEPDAGGGLPPEQELRKDRQWPSLGDETPVWCLYLDDSTFLRKMELKVAESLLGLPSREQENMRRAYQFWGIPFNTQKAISECEEAERLGAFVDGRRGRVGVTVRRLLECMSLGIFILGQGQVGQKMLQVFCGKEVHTLQFRRPLFSVYDEIWKLIMDPSGEPFLNYKCCNEIVASLALAPLRFTDWRVGLDPFAMASDASESGGGFVIAKRLTKLGVAAALQPEVRDDSVHNGIIVIDFFAGIGGLLRALERAGLKWERHITIEKDPGCRRLIRRTWPGGSECSDITKLTTKDLIKEIEKVQNPKLVIAGGGSPCQGFSKLSAARKHFADERSKLFYDFSDYMEGLKNYCGDESIDFLGFCENVVMDEKDRDEISMTLGYRPHLCESGEVSRVRRPRFYWLAEDLPAMPWAEVTSFSDVAIRVKLSGPMEPDELWMPKGYSWTGSGTDLRFPTFTRPIVRDRPPLEPAGLKNTSQPARERWRLDRFRFPPYTYEERFLVESPKGNLEKLPASSREILMGFLRLNRELFAKTSKEMAEDTRQSAIGNGFHTTTLALLLGSLLYKKGYLAKVKGPEELLGSFIIECEEQEDSDVVAEDDDSLSGKPSPISNWEFDETAMVSEAPQPDLAPELQATELMSRLVGHFLRKVEIKGSDIRLDTDVVFKPGACPRSAIDPAKWEWRHGRAFKWRQSQHINLLELKALLHAIQWRSRRSGYHSFRTMILCDSQAVIAVVAKGRSSSKQVNFILRRLCALCLSLNVFLLVCYVDTAANPADRASRLFDKDAGEADKATMEK
eukprot:Skav207224  [mRNA]  locus=scaffold1717:49410:52959:+ [translate_table: standard]